MPLYLGSNQKTRVAVTRVSPIIEIDDPDELTSLLVAENIGNIYRYTGETNETYSNGDLYEVVSL